MSDEEGAICDECGTRIGPHGCCATRRAADVQLSAVNVERDRLYRVAEEATAIVALLNLVGVETEWRDGDETDRVYSWAEFEPLRKALEKLGNRPAEATDVQ